jgi:hypothetical protein
VHADEEIAVVWTEDMLVLHRVFWRYETRFDAANFSKYSNFSARLPMKWNCRALCLRVSVLCIFDRQGKFGSIQMRRCMRNVVGNAGPGDVSTVEASWWDVESSPGITKDDASGFQELLRQSTRHCFARWR